MAVQDTVTIPKYHTQDLTGPASYASPGIVVDMSTTFAFLRYVEPAITTVGNLPPCKYEITLNDNQGTYAMGKATIKLMRDRYDKQANGAGEMDITGKPSGVTVRTVKFATAESTNSPHTHSIDHDHPSATSGTPTAGGDGVNAALGLPAISTHTHTVDVAAFTGSTPSSGQHTHDRSFEYDHNHSVTTTSTRMTATEISNGTNLSTTVWKLLVIGD